MASPAAGDPSLRACKLALACRRQWAKDFKRGRELVEEMGEERTRMLEQEDSGFSPKLQGLCDQLKTVLESQEGQAGVMRQLEERLGAAAELEETGAAERRIFPAEKMRAAAGAMAKGMEMQLKVRGH